MVDVIVVINVETDEIIYKRHGLNKPILIKEHTKKYIL